MRTRTRTTINDSTSWPAGTDNYVHVYCAGGGTSGTQARAAGSVDLDTVTETITDSLGRGKINSCTHSYQRKLITKADSWGFGNAIGAGTKITVTTPTASSICNAVYNDGNGAPGSLGRNWSTTGVFDENVMKNDVLERAKGLKADVLLNIVEANQVWPSLTSLTMALPNMAKNWKAIRKLIRTASGSFLAWKFGVSPILSDVMSINRYLPVMGRDLQRHADGDKSRFSAYANNPHTLPNASMVQGGMFGSTPAFLLSVQGYQMGICGVRYVLVVKPTTKYLTGFFQKLDFTMRRFASSPASLAWEKIPFSFVIDWFVDIRGSLNTLDSALGFSPYEVVGFSRSNQYHRMTEVFMQANSPCGTVWGPLRCGSLEEKYYERSPVPVGSSLASLRPRFGKSQAGISAALISQQLSKL